MFLISIYLIIFKIFLFLLWILQIFIKDDKFDKIPGPKRLFLLGNSLDLLLDEVEIFNFFRNMAKKYKDLFKLQLLTVKVIMIYSPEDAEALLSGTNHTKKGFPYAFLRPWLRDGLLLSDGPKWLQRRKILTPAFHFNILRNFSSVIIAHCEKTVRQLEPETEKDKTAILSFVTNFTINSICETAMGTSLDEELNNSSHKYKTAIHELGTYLFERATKIWLHSDFIFKFSKLSRKQNNTLQNITSFTNRVIKKRRENPQAHINNALEDDDFFCAENKLAMLDILLKAESEGKIDEDGICEEVDTFMFEGHDTTASVLQFTLMLVANHQNVQDKIMEELNTIWTIGDQHPTMNDLNKMKYLECCIKESLRLYPPVHFISRYASQTLKFKNYECSPNTNVVLLIYDLHRQEDQYIEPLKFMPERFMVDPTWHRYAYIPFSAGPRNCIGQKFAMMEMKLVVSAILRRYRLMPVTKPKDLVFITDVILRCKDPIYVKFEKRMKN